MDMEHLQTFGGARLLLGPNAETSTFFQNSSGDHFYERDPGWVLGSVASPGGIEATPDNSCIHNCTLQWPTSAMSQFPLYKPYEFSLSYWSGMYDSPSFTTPSAVHGMKPTETETQPGVSPQFSRHSSRVSDASVSESQLHMGNQSPSHQCYSQWKQVPMDAVIVTGTDIFVPQTLYKPSTETDKERYLEKAALSLPIIFETNEWGLSLEDALDGKMQHLVDRDVPVLQDCGPSISIRINWPGYPSFKRQISSRNWRKTKGPITKGKLAQSLAKTATQFVEKMSTKPLEFGAEENWRIGSQHIKAEDLILVSLHHVSKGSWQPQFRLRRDIP